MFRIDKSSVSYKKDVQPFVLAHAAMMRPAPMAVPVETPVFSEIPEDTLPEGVLEQAVDAVEEQPVQPEEPAVILPDPAELVEQARREAEGIILAAQEVAAAAQEAVSAAQEKASALIANATLEAEEMKQKAQEEGASRGHSEGFARGKAEGVAAYNAAVLDAQKLLNSAVSRVEAERENLLADVEKQCVDLAMDIAWKVIGTSFALDENAFPTLVRRALEEIQHEGRVTVRVSPLEYEIFFSEDAGWLSDETRVVNVVADETLGEGGLKLESEIEELNAGVRAQMGAIRKAIAQLGGSQ